MSSDEDDGPSTSSSMPKKPRQSASKKHKQQKYRKQWETDERFKKWIEPVKTNPLKARCRICDVSITAELTVLKNHEKGSKHQKLISSLVSRQVKITSLGFGVSKNDPKDVKIQTTEIKIAGFIAEHNISFNTADHLIDMIKNCFDDSDVAKGISLKRTKCQGVIKNVIGQSFKEELISKLKETKFSVLIDESTDISSVKSMCVVVRFFDLSQGKIGSKFFELKNIFDGSDPAMANEGATAERLYSVLMNLFDCYNIPRDNIIGFGSDGCNTMMGPNNSIASRLKDDFPGIVILKCVCHSLHLCASEACKELPKELEDLIRGIFNFVHGSAKRMALLEQFQRFVEIDIHKMLHPSQTRWLCVMAAIDRVVEQWDALRLFFIDMSMSEKSKHVEEIVSWLHNPFIKMYLFFLKWTLPKFTHLNEYFQSNRVLVTRLHAKFKEIYIEFILCFLKRDYVMKTMNSERPIEVENSTYWLSNNEMYLGVDVLFALQKKEIYSQKENVNQFIDRCRAFFIRSVLEINKRYDFKDPVLSLLPALSQREALSSEYRKTNPSLLPLILALPRVATDATSHQALDDEWRKLPILKDYLPKEIVEITPKSNDDVFWFNLMNYKNILGETEFKVLPQFALNALSIPHANADCERVFSKVNNVKTKSRNKLVTETVDKVLTACEGIKASGNCTSFKPSADMLSKMTSANIYRSRSGPEIAVPARQDDDEEQVFFDME